MPNCINPLITDKFLITFLNISFRQPITENDNDFPKKMIMISQKNCSDCIIKLLKLNLLICSSKNQRSIVVMVTGLPPHFYAKARQLNKDDMKY